MALGLAAGGLVATPAAAFAGGPPYTSWDLRADDGSFGSVTGEHFDTGITMTGDRNVLDFRVGKEVVGLRPAPGDVLAAGRTYTVPERTQDNEGTRATFGWDEGSSSVCGDFHGSFTVHELATDLAGNATSAVISFATSCDHHSALTYGAMAFNATTAPPALPPTVPAGDAFRAKVDHRNIVVGQSVQLQVRLDPAATFRDVTVLARTATGRGHGKNPDQVVSEQTVDASGQFTLTLRPTTNVRLIARLHLGGRVPDRDYPVEVTVRGKLRSRVFRQDGHRGHTHLFRVGHDAIVGSALSPNHHGDCLVFHVQYSVRGSWGYDGYSRCVKLDKHSAAYLRVPATRGLLRIPVRVRPEWGGDKRNARARGKWVYLRIVR